jgi:hypothetical protein
MFRNLLNKGKKLIVNIYKDIVTNLPYYLFFQLLFNLLIILNASLVINKLTGENFWFNFFTLGLIFIYSIPVVIISWLISLINQFTLNVTTNESVSKFIILFCFYISTLIYCNLPPFAKFFKSLFKIKNPRVELIVNFVLLIIVIYTTLQVKLFTGSN